MPLSQVLARIDAQMDASVERLKDFVRIPSISAGAEEDSAPHLGRAADFLLEEFSAMGFGAEKVQVGEGTNPLVVARSPRFSAGRPTVLVYGHYDVQGVDNPRSAWRVDPFAARVENGFLIGRGASDNKGPTFAHLCAARALLEVEGALPVNLVFAVEGEEECGSRALSRFVAEGGLEAFGPLLCTLISDTSMYGPDQPSLTLGLRGIYFTEVVVHGPRQDVHSGLFGGILHNPNNLLVRALAALQGEDGRVAVPGFYDEVRPLDEREKSLFAGLEVDEAAYCENLGVQTLAGEAGYSVLERRWARPTLDINFLSGGSPRTVIPALARAVLSCRLVPDQDPAEIERAVQEFVRARMPPGARVEFSRTHKSPAYLLDLEHPLVEKVLRALRTGFQTEPALSREGGSIPIVVDIAARTQAPVLLVGLGQTTDNWHGPNEHFNLRDFHRGMRTSAALLYELAT